jgi:glyoxylase-like metal-dependent hydrolase (beta-lactamase superfamily II)
MATVSSTRHQFRGASVRLTAFASLSGGARARQPVAAGEAAIRATALAPGFTLLEGAGENVVALRGDEGASLLVDGGAEQHSQALLQAATRVTGNRKVGTLINTHWHPAQTGSNETLGKAGALIIAHENTRQNLGRQISSVDYEGLYGPLPRAARPGRTLRTSDSLSFEGRQVDLGYLPAAHTNGDLYIHFPEANLLVAGGPVCSDTWPIIDYRNGARLGGLVAAHEKLVQLVKPHTIIVPASGRAITGEDLTRQHEMFVAFHQKMVAWHNKGMDSGECIAARPLRANEAQFGDPVKFIYAAFQSLNLAYLPD